MLSYSCGGVVASSVIASGSDNVVEIVLYSCGVVVR